MVTKKMMEIKKEKRNVKKFLIFGFALILTSCSSVIKVKTPAMRFISPETSGASGAGYIQAAVAQGTVSEIDLDNERVDDPVIFNEASSDLNLLALININAGVGVHEKIDIIAILNPGPSPSYIGGQFQIFGDSKKNAKQGNHSLSVTAMLGGGNSTQVNDDAVELTPVDEEAEVELGIGSSDFSIIYGYRITDRFLIYTGASRTQTNYVGDLTSDNVNLDGQELKNEATIDGYHVGLQLDVGKKGFLKLEHAGQRVNWQNTPARSFNYTSAGMGFYWE